MQTQLITLLENNVGRAVLLVLKSGKTINAGIEQVNTGSNTVRYMSGRGLFALKEAQDKKLPDSEILKNENFYSTISIDEIAELK